MERFEGADGIMGKEVRKNLAVWPLAMAKMVIAYSVKRTDETQEDFEESCEDTVEFMEIIEYNSRKAIEEDTAWKEMLAKYGLKKRR